MGCSNQRSNTLIEQPTPINTQHKQQIQQLPTHTRTTQSTKPNDDDDIDIKIYAEMLVNENKEEILGFGGGGG